jgi:hypothetical protein
MIYAWITLPVLLLNSILNSYVKFDVVSLPKCGHMFHLHCVRYVDRYCFFFCMVIYIVMRTFIKRELSEQVSFFLLAV